MGIISDYQKIGVVGIYNSGKTVFLTSLINHILHHDPMDFRVSPGRLDRTLAGIPVLGGLFRHDAIRMRKAHPGRLKESERPFEYDQYRDQLVRNGVWPEKTCADSHYRVRFQFSNELLWERNL